VLRGSALTWGTTPPRWRLSIRSQQVATLPWFRAGGGYLVPLFAAQSRHEEPYPPMSKSNPTFPFTIPLKGTRESVHHSPAAFKREMQFLEVCRHIDPTQVAKTGQQLFSRFYQQPMGLCAGSFKRCFRSCAAKMAALHAAGAGRSADVSARRQTEITKVPYGGNR